MAEPSERADLLAVAAACLAGAAPQLPLDAIVDFYVTVKAQAVRPMTSVPREVRPTAFHYRGQEDRCSIAGCSCYLLSPGIVRRKHR